MVPRGKVLKRYIGVHGVRKFRERDFQAEEVEKPTFRAKEAVTGEGEGVNSGGEEESVVQGKDARAWNADYELVELELSKESDSSLQAPQTFPKVSRWEGQHGSGHPACFCPYPASKLQTQRNSLHRSVVQAGTLEPGIRAWP